MSDWTTTDLRRRSKAAATYTDYANVPVGDDTYEIPYQLLDQEQQLEVQAKIDMSSIVEADGEVELDDHIEEAEQTVQELQSKEELTESEEQRLREAQTTLMKNQGDILDALNKETLMAFHDAGRQAIEPDEEDVSAVLENPIESQSRFEAVDSAPTPQNGEWTRSMARKAVRREMRQILDDVPFMIYFTLGQQVWEESQSAGELVGSSEDET